MSAIDQIGGVECGDLPEVFFPFGESFDMLNYQIEIAKSYCERCPIAALCANYAIEMEEPFGIWGGLTPQERRIAKRRKK